MKTKRRGGQGITTRRGGKRKTKKSLKRRGRRSGQRGGGCASRGNCDADYYKRIQGVGDTCRNFQRSSFHSNDCGYGLHQWRQYRWRHCRNPRGQDGPCRGAALTGVGADVRGGASAVFDVPSISPGSVIIHRSNTDIKTERARAAAERKADSHRTLAEEAARRRAAADRLTAELERRRQLALAEEQRQEAMMAERTRRAMEESRAAVAAEAAEAAMAEPGPQPTPVFKDETEHLFDGGLFGGGKRTRRRRRTRRGKR